MLRILNFFRSALRVGSRRAWHDQQSQRESRARDMVSTASHCVRSRFPHKVLAPLLDAGWHEGRCWESERIQNFLTRFDTTFPPAAIKVLSEFGGLEIGFRGRTIVFGDIDERLCASRTILRSLVGESLFPVGTTNIFEDDGLGVLIDASGQMYVDGDTGDDPPRDCRLDLISPSIDRFLGHLFSGDGIPKQKSWYYSHLDLS